MKPFIPGLHHVTAITGDPQRNLDFYAGVLGLRLVKQTVNFDDPSSYHLYYGDAAGRPGTIMTFFGVPGARIGAIGASQVTSTAFVVGKGSIQTYWRNFLERKGVTPVLADRFTQPVAQFHDPDGLALELVEAGQGETIEGFHGVTLTVPDPVGTEKVLVELMGYQRVGLEGERVRLRAPEKGFVDLLPGKIPGRPGAGTVHQQAWMDKLATHGHRTSPIMDRNYFESIYFREPSGVLFEIATDPPGFAVDEEPSQLGGKLMLPDWLESRRASVEQLLPALVAH